MPPLEAGVTDESFHAQPFKRYVEQASDEWRIKWGVPEQQPEEQRAIDCVERCVDIRVGAQFARSLRRLEQRAAFLATRQREAGIGA